jgi:hypothetical protein
MPVEVLQGVNMKSKKFYALVLAVLAMVCASSGFAQTDRGSINGTVKDPSGAVVPNAKVTVTNLDSGEVRETTTSDEGAFNLPELKADPYRLTVESAGFKTATIDTIQVAVQVARRADVTLEIGEVGETVTVSSDTTVLQTDSPVQQLNVTERQVKELPLLVSAESGGRSPLSFIFLDSNVTPTGSGSSGTNASNFKVNGGQGLGTDILIDGAATRRAENGTFFSEVAPGPNAFQEFTLSTSNYAAEFGNSTGGIVNFTIKSGGNEFHGESWYFLRNEALNANIDLNRLNGFDRPLDRQKDFGFNVGGPVYLPRFGEGGPTYWSGKNRTFFFFNYGGYRISQSETVALSVPTLRMRSGDFSELLTDPYVLGFFGGPVQVYSPIASYDTAGNPVPAAAGSRTPIPGNRIDLFRLPSGQGIIDPAGFNILQLFPQPTSAGVFRNYLASSNAGSTTNYYVGKVTHIISDRQSLNFSYTYRKLDSDKGGFPRFPLPFVQNGFFQQNFRSYYARLQYDLSITPKLLNHFNAGFSRSFVFNGNVTRGLSSTALGLPANSTQNLGLPLIGFPNYGDPVTSRDPRSYQGAGSTFFNNTDGDNAVQFNDFVTYSSGRHTFKFGAETRFQQLNDSNHFDIGGQFNFQSGQTANDTTNGTQGSPIASLITGANEFAFNSVQTIDPGFRFFSPGFFAQDDFKVTPRLTLNLGVRYDIAYPRVEAHDRYRGFDPTKPNPAAGGRLGAIAGAAGQGGVQADYRGLVKPDYSNLGPRFGFAYALNDRTVVRGGYGLYYAPLLYNDFGRAGSAGYNADQLVAVGGTDVRTFLRNFPALPTVDPNSQGVGRLDDTVNYFDKDFKLGRTAQYSLDIQRELPSNFVVSVSYIGHKATRLRSRFNPLNTLPLEALRLGNPLLTKQLNDVTVQERAYAQSVGFTLPANGNAVYPGFNSAGGRFAGTVAQALRTFPQYSRSINNALESQGKSSYNALTVKLDRRFTQGIQFGASYTFSKLVTDAAEDLFGDSPLNSVLQNPYDRTSLRSISPNSIPHSLVINGIYELPVGKGKRFLNKAGLVDRLVGGFQITGVARYRSGPALVPFVAGRGDFTDLFGVGGNLRPNYTGAPFYTENPATGTTYRYLNPAAFVAPPRFEAVPTTDVTDARYRAYYADPLRFFGNAAPTYNDLRGQPFFSEDLSIMKKTRITESSYLELRAEIFNLFNRGRFGLPDVNVDNQPNYGISGRNGDINQPRRVQLGARFVF